MSGPVFEAQDRRGSRDGSRVGSDSHGCNGRPVVDAPDTLRWVCERLVLDRCDREVGALLEGRADGEAAGLLLRGGGCDGCEAAQARPKAAQTHAFVSYTAAQRSYDEQKLGGKNELEYVRH